MLRESHFGCGTIVAIAEIFITEIVITIIAVLAVLYLATLPSRYISEFR